MKTIGLNKFHGLRNTNAATVLAVRLQAKFIRLSVLVILSLAASWVGFSWAVPEQIPDLRERSHLDERPSVDQSDRTKTPDLASVSSMNKANKHSASIASMEFSTSGLSDTNQSNESPLSSNVAGSNQASDAELFDQSLLNDQLSVRELMRLEMAEALEAARQKRLIQRQKSKSSGWVGPKTGSNQDSEDALGSPKLLAIYGVGKQLWAEVKVGTKTLLFKHDQAVPIGFKPGNTPYRLQSISTRCVSLSVEGEQKEYCLSLS